MSSSRKQAPSKVERAVLRWLAERLGPAIDQVDVTGEATLAVRDVVAALVDAGVGTPSEIRAALLDLAERGEVGADKGLMLGASRVGLTDRGLVAARRLQPGIGRARQLTLRLNARGPEFAGRIETGEKALDARLRGSGVVLACFYALAYLRPEASRPVTIGELRDVLARLAVHGIGPRTGPGVRIETRHETIRDALETLTAVLPLAVVPHETDGRREQWVLTAPLPGVRMVVPPSRAHMRDWQQVVGQLRTLIGDGARARSRVAGE